jgi:hypothetical protein
MEPSPFHEKDLDHDAEEFIVSWAQEYAGISPERSARFAYSHLNRLELKRLLKKGRTRFVIGSPFLGAAFS